MRIKMVSRRSIKDFYEKYMKNLKREEVINDSLLKADDQEAWIENLRTKSKMLRTLYIENEAMLNLYLRPFIEQESRIDDELADEFLEQIERLFEQGLSDRLICIDISQVLQRYFKRNNNFVKWFRITYALGGFYSRISGLENVNKCLECYELIRNEFPRYAKIDDWNIRRRLLFSFYNYAVVLMNSKPFAEQMGFTLPEYEKNLLSEVDKALAVYDDPVVRALDGDKYDLDGLKDELNYDVFGNWICGCDSREEMSPETFERALRIMDELYKSALEEDGDIFHMKDEIFCNYWKGQYCAGNLEIEEYINKITDFCNYTLEHPDVDEFDDISDSKYYQVNMYQITNLAGTPGVAEHPQLKEKLKNYILPQFKKFISELPRTRHASYINESIKRTLMELVRSLGTEEIDSYYFLDVLMNRDETMMIHVSIVKRVALMIMNSIFNTEPELLVGVCKTQNVLEVLEKRNEIEQLVSQAALVFDIGKSNYIELITLQSRRLLAREKEVIHRHAAQGAELLETLGFSRDICDIAYGHHKSYDGKSGYPEKFDNTKSRVHFLIDLFKICDCMDAATDDIGRIYNKVKTMPEFIDELEFGAGHLYNPDIVRILSSDEQLKKELGYTCSAGRIALYYEAYDTFIDNSEDTDNENNEQIKCIGDIEPDNNRESEQADLLENMQEMGREQAQVLESLAKSSIFIARINLSDDTFRIVHNSDRGVLKGSKEGSFTGFIRHIGKEAFHPDDYPMIRRLMDYGEFSDYIYSSNGSFEMEVRLKEGSEWKWRRINFALAEEKNGVPQVVILSINDIDYAKKQREQMKEAMELAYKQAKQASAAKSEFLSNMSHDIRTPMNVILGMTQIAGKNTDNPEKIKDCLSKIEQASQHLLELINDVLDMSKIESGKIELNEKPVDIVELMKNVIFMVQDMAAKKSIESRINIDALPKEMVICDPVRVQEILINLLSNAVKYTPEGRWISFTAKKTASLGGYNSYKFIVEDGGIGMSADFLDKIFEPFSREHTEQTQNIQGTGLGLSITKSIIDIMQGNIDVTSEREKGSRFEVSLRFRISGEKAYEGENEEQTVPQDWDGKLAGHRILLVEDNELNREIFVELVSSTGVEIDTSVNGLEGVERVREHEPGYYDMVFMDVQMPVMDGYEATKHIRELERERSEAQERLPIIALTANAFSEDSDKAVKAGMNAHLSKPISVPKLMSVMARWIVV